MRAALMVLLTRNLGFLFFAFAASAYVNVLPQLVFARTAPATKSLWLAATLLIGTLGCMAAVGLARQLGYGNRPRLVGGLITIAIVAILLLATGVTHPLSFAALCVALRGLCQYASQETDRRAAALAGAALRARNDAVSLSLRFAGMLAGPLFVGLHPDFDGLSAAVYLVLSLLSLCGALAVAPAPPAVMTASAGEIAASALPLRRSDHLVIWAGRLTFAGYSMLSACVLYALRDLHGLVDAARRGSTMITAAFGAAMIATPFLAALRGRVARRHALLGMLPAPIGVVAAGLLLPSPSTAQLVPGLGGAALLGVGFAAFQLSFRDYASHQAIEGGRKELLAIFNNLSNTSALVAFGVMLGLSLVARALAVEPARTSAIGVAVLGLAAVAMTLLARRAHRRTAA
jgi:hypothetical protein